MNLADYFNVSKSTNKVWIDMISYANQLFAQESENLWSNPTNFISVYSQAQGLLKSDVLSIPVMNVYEDLLIHETELIEQWAGKSPTFILKKLLGCDEPKQFLINVLTGLHNLYMGAVPLALVLPSPQHWFKWIREKFKPSEDIQIVEDDIEIASMYVAEYLQHLSDLNISIIVIHEEENTFMKVSEALFLYQPILNVVNHFQWKIGIECSVSTRDIEKMNDEVDFILFKNSSFTDVAPYWQKNMAIGGGLDKSFWENDGNDKRELAGLIYGEIPYDAYPEDVLTQLNTLRSK